MARAARPAPSKARARTTSQAKTPAKPAAKPAAAKTAKKPATKAKPKPRPAAKKPAARRPAKPVRAVNLGPHQCTYSAETFRSQLEARWAIFFDVLGWDWDYEPCHYPLGPDLGYLPDFYLPGLALWVEGKGPTFLDAPSMGKIVNAVAGPQPLPLRTPPYWPNNGLLLLGPMQPLPDRGSPIHTLLLPGGAQRAATWRSVLTPTGPTPVGKKPWATWPATGAKPARRPGPTQNRALLLPEAEPSFDPHPSVTAAYRVALATSFGPTGQAVLPDVPAAVHLRHRRRGRPYQPGGVLAA